jgi:hypothetical protein
MKSVLERQVRKLGGGALGQPERAVVDRSAKADVCVALGGVMIWVAVTAAAAPIGASE